MSQSRLVLTDPAEAAVVAQLQVRLMRSEEAVAWNRLMAEHHSLKNAQMVGEQLRYVAQYRGQWMALLGWSAAAYHLKGRDGEIGWDENQRRARLHLGANNTRFCRLGAAGQYPNLASRAMALNLDRLDLDGTIALMDALHTQVATARCIVQEGGGDYVLFVKGNQKGLQDQARHFLPEDFSPSIPNGGSRPWADRMARHPSSGSNSRADGLSARGAGGAD